MLTRMQFPSGPFWVPLWGVCVYLCMLSHESWGLAFVLRVQWLKAA